MIAGLTPRGFFNLRRMNSLITYLKNVRTELGHVAWPTTRTAIAHTLVVILIAAAIGVLVGVLDYLLTGLISRLVGAV